MLKEQQRMDFIKAQEEDRRKIEQKEKEEETKQKQEEEKRNYEQTRKELAQSKKKELPPEPTEGNSKPWTICYVKLKNCISHLIFPIKLFDNFNLYLHKFYYFYIKLFLNNIF